MSPSAKSLKAAAAMVNNLKVFPEVALKIRELVNDPNAEVSDLVKVIETDPVLIMRIMKMSSTAGRGSRRAVADLDDAVRRLGFRAVRDIAMAMCFGAVAARTPEGEALWQHSIEVAAACRVVSRDADRRTREAMFLAGLLHDLGRILMLEIDQDWCAANAELPDDASRCSEEKEHFGWDHGLLGGQCVRSFGISGDVADMVHAHHTTRMLMRSSPSDQNIRRLRVAERISRAPEGAPIEPASDTKGLRLDVDALQRFADEYPAELEALKAQLEGPSVPGPARAGRGGRSPARRAPPRRGRSSYR